MKAYLTDGQSICAALDSQGFHANLLYLFAEKRGAWPSHRHLRDGSHYGKHYLCRLGIPGSCSWEPMTVVGRIKDITESSSSEVVSMSIRRSCSRTQLTGEDIFLGFPPLSSFLPTVSFHSDFLKSYQGIRERGLGTD